MNRKNYIAQTINDGLVFLIISLSPVANLAFQKSFLGVLGASAALPFVFILMCFYLLRFISNFKINLRLLNVFLYCVFVSLLYSLFIDGYVNNENSYEKGFKIFIIYALLFFIVKIKVYNRNVLTYSSFLGLGISLISVMLPELQSIEFFNYRGSNEGRPRGLTMESSHFACIVGAISFLGFYSAEKQKTKYFFVLFGFLLILYSESKGGILFYSISYMIYHVLNEVESRKKLLWMFVGVFLLILISLYILPLITFRISNDINMYTSTSTRLNGFISSLLIVLENPLGVGFFGYSEYLIQALSRSIQISLQINPNFNITEVLLYLSQSGTESLGTKSFFADTLILFGLGWLFFIIIYLNETIKTISSKKYFYLFPGFVFSILSLFFWIAGPSFYVLFIIFALCNSAAEFNER